MILPTKHLPLSRSYLNVGAIILDMINNKRTVSLLWDAIKGRHEVQSFDRFVLGLDMLFVLGLIDISDEGVIVRKRGRRP